MNRLRWLRAYYAATPLFILIDWIWGVNVRAAGLQAYPIAKALYYVFCLVCAYFVLRRSEFRAPVALLENSVNITVLIVSFLSPMYRLIGQDWTTTQIVNPYTPAMLMNFGLSGAGLLAAFYRQAPLSPVS